MAVHRPSRLRSFTYVGLHRYFLTFCTFERRRHFEAADIVHRVWSQIVRAADDEEFEVHAYCFMPDHLHMLVAGAADYSDGRRFISRAKQFSGYEFSRARGSRLWQEYGYEHTLRDTDDGAGVVRYILENPVRAGLAATPDAYRYSGSMRYSVPELLTAVTWRPPQSRDRR